MTIERHRHVYVFAIGLDAAVPDVLARIEERLYARRFAGDPKVIHRIGCVFDAETGLLTGWEAV